jgi:type IV pilus assembly protein PilB
LGDAEVQGVWGSKPQYRVPKIALRQYEIDPKDVALVPRELCEKHTVMPVSRTGKALIVAMTDPNDTTAIDALKAHTGLNIEPVIAARDDILEAIAKYYGA